MRENIKKHRLLTIKQMDKFMNNDLKWMSLSNKQKWKSIYKHIKKIEKINFNKNGELIKE